MIDKKGSSNINLNIVGVPFSVRVPQGRSIKDFRKDMRRLRVEKICKFIKVQYTIRPIEEGEKSFLLSHKVLEDLNSIPEKMVYTSVCSFVDENTRQGCISRTEIARRARFSVSTVDRCIKKLISYGYLKKERTEGANFYTLMNEEEDKSGEKTD